MSSFLSWFIPVCGFVCIAVCLLVVRKRPSWKILSRIIGFLLLIAALTCVFTTPFGDWKIANPPCIVVILDRSASMGARPEGNISLQEQAIEQIKSVIKKNPSTEWVIIDSATKGQMPIASLDQLETTDTACNFPELIHSASKALEGKDSSTSEIWVFSDMQKSNWSANRNGIKEQETEHLPLPRIRVISLRERPLSNIAVRVDSSSVIDGNLNISFTISRDGKGMLQAASLPLSIHIGDQTIKEIIPLPPEKSTRFERTIPLPSGESYGFGCVSIPRDHVSFDDSSYFVFSPQPRPRIMVAWQSKQIGETLANMATPPGTKEASTSTYRIGTSSPLELSNHSLLIWQGSPPTTKERDEIETFMKEGGYVLFLPDRNQTKPLSLWNGIKWLPPDIKTSEATFEISSFVENRGILKNGKDLIPLPLHHVKSIRKISCVGEGLRSLAQWNDGTDAILSKPVGKGGMIICTTLPIYSWSNLADGSILLPLIHRLADMGTRIQTGTFSFPVGSQKLRSIINDEIICLLPTGTSARSPLLHVGVFHNDTSTFCANRPLREDDSTQITTEDLAPLFPQTTISEYPLASVMNPSPFCLVPWWYWMSMSILLLVIPELAFLGKK